MLRDVLIIRKRISWEKLWPNHVYNTHTTNYVMVHTCILQECVIISDSNSQWPTIHTQPTHHCDTTTSHLQDMASMTAHLTRCVPLSEYIMFIIDNIRLQVGSTSLQTPSLKHSLLPGPVSSYPRSHSYKAMDPTVVELTLTVPSVGDESDPQSRTVCVCVCVCLFIDITMHGIVLTINNLSTCTVHA